MPDTLLQLAERCEQIALEAAKMATSKEPWAGQYATGQMAYAANAFAVAAALRAHAQLTGDAS